MTILQAHSWPGNIRELENAIERGVILCRGDTITPQDLPPDLTRSVSAPEPGQTLPLRKALEIPEREIIERTLRSHNWNRQETARRADDQPHDALQQDAEVRPARAAAAAADRAQRPRSRADCTAPPAGPRPADTLRPGRTGDTSHRRVEADAGRGQSTVPPRRPRRAATHPDDAAPPVEHEPRRPRGACGVGQQDLERRRCRQPGSTRSHARGPRRPPALTSTSRPSKGSPRLGRASRGRAPRAPRAGRGGVPGSSVRGRSMPMRAAVAHAVPFAPRPRNRASSGRDRPRVHASRRGVATTVVDAAGRRVATLSRRGRRGRPRSPRPAPRR